MLSVFRVATPVTTLKLSSPPHQLGPYSPLGKRPTVAVALADASKPTVTSPGPLARLFIQQSPLLTRPLPVCDVGSDADANNNPANPDTSVTPTVHHSSASFPVHGPFDILHCIQKGGFGSAWAAKDQTTGRLLCLKAFQSLQDQNVARSIRTELRVFRRMVKAKGGERGKQFIIELNRSIQHGNTVLFAMELLTTDLGMYMCTDPERCKMHARRWTAQIALGIESLHEMGILHRDIKSENILIDSRENVRIIDFGLSYLNPTGQPLREASKYPVEFLGTPPYIAPEVLQNKGASVHRRRPYGMAVDWWALGCILFELESREHQILFDTEEDVRAYIAWTQRPCQPEEMYPRFEGLDPVVVNLLEGLLKVQPSHRYSLNDMENHTYFLDSDGTSEFDNAAARALDRPVCSELEPQLTENGPIMVIEAAKLSSIYDWTNLKWASLVDGSKIRNKATP